MSLKNDFLSGIIKENPVLVLMIGLCPTLAVSSTAVNGFGMGIAASFVLICSNIVIAMVRKYTPDQIRIPIFIIIISTFVTLTDYVMQAYYPALYKQLGVFVPLIVVNCIILGRAEAFAYKNGVLSSTLDGFGMGLGFTLVITVIGAIRELIGNGTIFGKAVFSPDFQPALIMILPPGGFITIGILMAFLHYYQNKAKEK
ncbi:MAG: electron transport complex subunit E [bacterium]|jgi:Na+-translocating ferredoxin:NAD+ oxidoreductase subunit E|nr:electron transport complex subunit E [bacterium]